MISRNKVLHIKKNRNYYKKSSQMDLIFLFNKQYNLACKSQARGLLEVNNYIFLTVILLHIQKGLLIHVPLSLI